MCICKTNRAPQPNQDGREWVASPQDVNEASEAGRDRRSLWTCCLTSVLAALALVMFIFAGVNCYRYLVGTPTTATVTDCTTRSNCRGTWSICGVSQTGPIAIEFSTPSVRSSLDVRVSGGTARTATFWLGSFVVGGVLIAGSILVFVLTRSRTGTLVGKRRIGGPTISRRRRCQRTHGEPAQRAESHQPYKSVRSAPSTFASTRSASLVHVSANPLVCG
jgi:hypothetical protein